MEQLEAERQSAAAALPSSYRVVTDGLIQAGDLVWNFVTSTWAPVKVPEPFGRGQKRPGWRQQTDIGQDVAQQVAVARPL